MAEKPIEVRTRFAPSPTGLLHVGALRTALFKYLYAKHTQGTFILRIDDTDRERLVPGALEQIMASLRELDLPWDEGPEVGGEYGPYVQSERFDIYKGYAQKLIENESLYPCWCSSDRLDSLRQEAQNHNRAFKYDRYCLEHPGDPKSPHVLRFRIPDENVAISWDDKVKGKVTFQSSDLDDFVAIKSDGWPTYHFSSIVDDHTMKISHVIRGDEWVASTPKHLLLYQAFGWEPPIYAHLPVILGPDGKKKLSKRDGVKSASEYIQEGFLPEVLVNFLALLGWNAGEGSTQEIYSRNELIQSFTLERIQKSPAKFDIERLNWMNGLYLRTLSLDELAQRAQDFWPPEGKKAHPDYQKKVLELIQERIKFLAEIPELTDFFFTDPNPEAIKQVTKLEPTETKKYLTQALTALSDVKFEHDPIEAALRRLADELDTKPGNLFSVLRIAITGKTAAPGLFETVAVLGKENTLRRLNAALDTIQKKP